MSNHLKGYTSFQKRVIKGLAELIEERPFSYKKTSNNHIEIKIKGIDRVFYSSGTPSDHRSYDNFLSDVRSTLRQQSEPEPVLLLSGKDGPETDKDSIDDRRQASLNKITRTIIKRIRMSIEKIQQDEWKAVLSEDDAHDNIIRTFRDNLVEREIQLAMKLKKEKDYFPTAMIKQTRSTIGDHLDFMLPTPAYYHDLLKKKLVPAFGDKADPEEKDDVSSGQPDNPEKGTSPQVTVQPEDRDQGMNLRQLVRAKRNKRLSEIKKLSKSEISSLVEDFQNALEQKHEEDIQDLVAQIKEKGITLAEIQERLE
ncbi:MAG: hypothetical protein CMH98_15160 [Oceanospirillaceae bacterium]|nr:hypothetical protein [Oceanospirillaceae bacterium]